MRFTVKTAALCWLSAGGNQPSSDIVPLDVSLVNHCTVKDLALVYADAAGWRCIMQDVLHTICMYMYLTCVQICIIYRWNVGLIILCVFFIVAILTFLWECIQKRARYNGRQHVTCCMILIGWNSEWKTVSFSHSEPRNASLVKAWPSWG